MTAPQQLALDEAHNAAYTVEFAPSGRLLRIDLTTGTQTPVLSNLDRPIGLVISQDLQYAYISEQMGGPDKGRVSRYKLSDGSRTPLATRLTHPSFLTWSDVSQTSMFVPERDPANRISLLTLSSGALLPVAGGVPGRPSSVAVTDPSEILVCSDQMIESVDLSFQQWQKSATFVPACFLKMTTEKKETKCDELIDALLEKHGISPEAVLGENGLIAQLKKRVVERALPES